MLVCANSFLSLLSQLERWRRENWRENVFCVDAAPRHSLIGYCSCLNSPGLVSTNLSPSRISVKSRHQWGLLTPFSSREEFSMRARIVICLRWDLNMYFSPRRDFTFGLGRETKRSTIFNRGFSRPRKKSVKTIIMNILYYVKMKFLF